MTKWYWAKFSCRQLTEKSLFIWYFQRTIKRHKIADGHSLPIELCCLKIKFFFLSSSSHQRPSEFQGQSTVLHLSLTLEWVSVPNVPFWSCAIAGPSILHVFKYYSEKLLADDAPATDRLGKWSPFYDGPCFLPQKLSGASPAALVGAGCAYCCEPFCSILYC